MLIDANVFKGFFQMEIGAEHPLCGCPRTLVGSASPNNPIYHDIDGIIESEWKTLVDREWFEAWLAHQLTVGSVAYIAKTTDTALERKLGQLGFPKGRDVVYIRAGLSVVNQTNACENFYTEDMDFFDPKQKKSGGTTRKKILQKASGGVAKILRKARLVVQCVP